MENGFEVTCQVSGRHYHPSAATVPPGLTKRNDMSQGGHWAADQFVEAHGMRFRVIMPPRAEELYEMSATDWALHMEGPPQFSGKFQVKLRHFHCSQATADKYALTNNQKVSIKIGGLRAAILNNVLVRIDEWSVDEVHLDWDEANSTFLKNGDKAFLIITPAPSA